MTLGWNFNKNKKTMFVNAVSRSPKKKKKTNQFLTGGSLE